jgi:hypothetical protein
MAGPRPAGGFAVAGISIERITDVVSRLILALGVGFVVAIPARLFLDPAAFAPMAVERYIRLFDVDRRGLVSAGLMQIETHLGAFAYSLFLIGERAGSSLYWIAVTVALYCGAVAVVLTALHRDADLSPALRRATAGLLLCFLFLFPHWSSFRNGATFEVPVNVALTILAMGSFALIASKGPEIPRRHIFFVVLCTELAVESHFAGLFTWTALIFIVFIARPPSRILVVTVVLSTALLLLSYSRFNWFSGGLVLPFILDPVRAVIAVSMSFGSLFQVFFFFEPLASISDAAAIVTGFAGICGAAYFVLCALVRREAARPGDFFWLGLLIYSAQWIVAVAVRHMPPDSLMLTLPGRFNLPAAVFWIALFALVARYAGRSPKAPVLAPVYIASAAGLGLLMALLQLHGVFITAM